MIPYGRQDILQEDIDAVVDVLKSDFLTQGPRIPTFEKELCQMTGAQFAAAVNSATSALHISCLALEVGKGDYVWTSPNSFVASSNCALYCGAQVDFVDIDPKTYNLCPKALEEKLIIAKENNCLPKVVIPVHFAGQSCEMQEIHNLSKNYGFKIIEDASHAIGGQYLDSPIGQCQYSDITVFSFHPVKIITTAEGGMALTNDSKLYEKLCLYRSHGVTRESHLLSKDQEGPWYYEQKDLGYNYRMTDIQAALGSSQLKRIKSFIEKRHSLAHYYFEQLKDLPLTLPFQSQNNYSAFHLFTIQVESQEMRKKAFLYLRANNIAVNVHYIPIHTQPYYQKLGFSKGDFPQAELYYSKALSLPLFPTLSRDQQDFVISHLKKFFESFQG